MIKGDLCLRLGHWNVGARGLVHLISYVWREASSSGLSAAYPGFLKEDKIIKKVCECGDSYSQNTTL